MTRRRRSIGPADAGGRCSRTPVQRRHSTTTRSPRDRRPATPAGPQAGGPARPRRAPARARTSATPGPGQLVAKPAASVAADPDGPVPRPHPGGRLRPAPGDRGGDRRAPVQDARRWRSSARTRSARRPTRPRRSCGSSSLAGAAGAAACRSRSRSRSPSCWPSSRSPTARSAAPTRAAAAPTSSRATNLAPLFGPDRGGGPAHRLRHDRRGLDGLGDRRRSSRSSRPAYDFRIEIAFVSISLITIANLRGLRESGNIFAVPTYLFVGAGPDDRGDRPRPHRRRDGRPVAAPARRGPVPGHAEALGDPAAAQGVRRRLGRADRRRGDRQRRAGVQAAGVEERGEHDDRDGRPARRSCSSASRVVRRRSSACGRPNRAAPTVVALVAETAFGDGLRPVRHCSRRARR